MSFYVLQNVILCACIHYTSLTYKVIVWKQIDGKSGTEFYIFPNNLHAQQKQAGLPMRERQKP